MGRLLQIIKNHIPRGFFRFLQPIYHFLLAFLAAMVYGFPSRKLQVVGVTGTKGKTTAVELMGAVLEGAGYRVASTSSLRVRIGDKETLNDRKMTMPGRFFLQKFLYEAVAAGCTHAIIEVTSEGVAQFRHRFISFHAAVLTNVAPEHIESHGSFERYLRAKLDLFWRLPHEGLAIINGDDANQDRFSAATAARKIYYGREGVKVGSNIFKIRNVSVSERGIQFDIKDTSVFSPLQGEFNMQNIIAAVAVGLGAHVSLEQIVSSIAGISGIPGRMEYIQHNPLTVVVDYAHTPDSLRNVYTLLRENSKLQIPNSKLICVLGAAGGGRDKWKRPEMGKIAAEFCDEVILTNEDPYDENPKEILDQISAGFSQISNSKFPAPEGRGSPKIIGRQTPNHRKILDRCKAIRGALKSAKPGDVVIITGKGAEPWIMGPAGTKIPWDDRRVVKEELAKRKVHP